MLPNDTKTVLADSTDETMKRNNNSPHTYSIGQVAKRWKISPERVRQLIDNGVLAGAFEIPSAGRFGKALRIPLEAVLAAEQQWAIASSPASSIKRPRRRSSSQLALKHFPELSGGPMTGEEEL